ncbi:MAG TPA: hypothetical protein VFO39_02080 [Candidatus Sulfotelmatobacter sp.]|nr:hypothetical protein [Candidatus Sulfotelmatobacter sp.]
MSLISVASISVLASLFAGIIGAFAAAFLFDRGMSKGNDLAVMLIGLHAVGTFTFVTLFTYLWSKRRVSSWKVPATCLALCILVLAIDTAWWSEAFDEYYANFFIGGWLVVGLSGALALFLSRRILARAAAKNFEIPVI